jgi:hypothetical protein
MAQTHILAKGDPRFSELHYPVICNDQSPGVVTIERDGQVIVLHTARGHEHYRWDGVVELARQKTLPGWCKQVAPIMERIERLFTAERQVGEDPHVRWVVTSEMVSRTNLPLGTGIQVEVRELQRRLANGEKLPKEFDRPAIRRVLGIE